MLSVSKLLYLNMYTFFNNEHLILFVVRDVRSIFIRIQFSASTDLLGSDLRCYMDFWEGLEENITYKPSQ